MKVKSLEVLNCSGARSEAAYVLPNLVGTWHGPLSPIFKKIAGRTVLPRVTLLALR